MSQSKLVSHTPFLSKRTVTNKKLTTRPLQHRILPEWMERDNINKLNKSRDLLCHEVIVKCVPSLTNIACAKIVNNGVYKNFNHYENHIWSRFGNENIDFIYETSNMKQYNWQSYDGSTSKSAFKEINVSHGSGIANQFNNLKNKYSFGGEVFAAYPNGGYDVILKTDIKNNNYEQLRPGLRPRQAIKRKLSFSDSD